MANESEIQNLSVNFSSETSKEIEEIRQSLGDVACADTLRRGVALLKIIVEAHKNGKEVLIVKPGEPPEKIILGLI